MKKIILGAVVAVLALAAAFSLGRGWQKQDGAPAVAASSPADAPRAILYYRNPMGLPDTSPTPKKDSMGMDYVPVYEGEEPAGSGMVSLSPEKVQKLGVRTAKVERTSLNRTIRASGSIAVNETKHHTIAPKFEGWIEKLHVSQTGAKVRRGQYLAEVYSPELVSAQQEYGIATQALAALSNSAGADRETMQALADAAVRRLRNWDIPEKELQALRDGAQPRRTLTIASPVDGVVLEKRAIAGMRFMPGEMLFDLADLSDVWLLAEVSAQDLSEIRVGQSVGFSTSALPQTEFAGSLAFIYPTMSQETRTVKVRVILPNPRGDLRPGLFGQVKIVSGGAELVPAVPSSAVLDSGVRQTVLVAHAGGRFEPREVRLGRRGDDLVEILEGVVEGEEVVVSANFLIDAESNLKSALGGLGSHGAHGASAPAAAQEPAAGPAPEPAEHSGHGK